MNVKILSTARPQPPKVAYVIPAFKWVNEKNGQTIKSKREGGWLRVYLERPWFSSGDGERLGVVLLPEPHGHDYTIDKRYRYVSKIAQDPTMEVRQPMYSISDEFLSGGVHFENKIVKGISLAETSMGAPEEKDLLVDIADHPVFFNEDQKLWYCDIKIKSPFLPYFPFIRLALVRYQPNSIDNLHISKVVLTDFVQLTPDRTATIVFSDTNDKKLSISVRGVSQANLSSGYNKVELEVDIEEYTRPHLGELGWTKIKTYPLISTNANLDMKSWINHIELPDFPTRRNYRLVIKKYEYHKTDPGRSEISFDIKKRLVYAATIDAKR